MILICSCYSGFGEQEPQPFLIIACEMRPMTSDHWLNRVPGDLHPQWVSSTDRGHTFGKCHLFKASEVSWTHNITAVYQAVIQPWNYIGLLFLKLQVRITITWKLPENANSQLYTLSTEQDLGGWWCAVGSNSFLKKFSTHHMAYWDFRSLTRAW